MSNPLLPTPVDTSVLKTPLKQPTTETQPKVDPIISLRHERVGDWEGTVLALKDTKAETGVTLLKLVETPEEVIGPGGHKLTFYETKSFSDADEKEKPVITVVAFGNGEDEVPVTAEFASMMFKRSRARYEKDPEKLFSMIALVQNVNPARDIISNIRLIIKDSVPRANQNLMAVVKIPVEKYKRNPIVGNIDTDMILSILIKTMMMFAVQEGSVAGAVRKIEESYPKKLEKLKMLLHGEQQEP